MNENGLDAISQSEQTQGPRGSIKLQELTLQTDIENLDIYDGVREAPGAFAAFDPGPPPAPKLKSKGVIAMDITEQFAYAAQRESIPGSPLVTCSHLSRAGAWAAHQGSLFYTVRVSWSLGGDLK